MRVELVTHCFRYSRLLRYHLSSIVLAPPSDIDLRVSVCYSAADQETTAVLNWFTPITASRVEWNWIEMPVLELCRRSIGRNRAALVTKADWVWFCDVDYWFGRRCWETFPLLPITRMPYIFPRYIQMHKTKALGDACIASADSREGLVTASPNDFEPVRMRCAIGGIQVAKGSVCRKRGYLNHWSRWQQPAPEPIFQRCREDMFFRRDLKNRGRAVLIPEIYRIRHSLAGRRHPNVCL